MSPYERKTAILRSRQNIRALEVKLLDIQDPQYTLLTSNGLDMLRNLLAQERIALKILQRKERR